MDNEQEKKDDLVRAVIAEAGLEEAMHLEAFIAAVNQITPEEHAEASIWLRHRREGKEVGPPPPGITKTRTIAKVDQRFWDVADTYHMHDTDFRLGFLMTMAQRLLEHEQKQQRQAARETPNE